MRMWRATLQGGLKNAFRVLPCKGAAGATLSAANLQFVGAAAVFGGTCCAAVLLRPRALRCDGPATPPDDWFSNPALCSDMSKLWSRTWNPDWDGRAPPPPDPGSEEPTIKTQGKVRHLLLIRHGQYQLDTDEQGLTELGREQSRRLGERLKAWTDGLQKDHYGEIKISYTGIWSSDVCRARQTAEILAECLPDVKLQAPDPMLAEAMPTVPHPSSRGSKTRPGDLWSEGCRIEAAFRKYVHRDVDHKRAAEKLKKEERKAARLASTAATGEFQVDAVAKTDAAQPKKESPNKPEHTYEIIVCHMNVIRYFVMRALQLPPEAWLRLRGDNTGITEIIVSPDGRVSLSRFADTGHLPIEMITFH